MLASSVRGVSDSQRSDVYNSMFISPKAIASQASSF